MDSLEESESLDSGFLAWATFACFFFFSMLALLALDSLLNNFDIAILIGPACNSVDFLAESPFGIRCFFLT
jgi:hypothetical protein